MNLTTNDFDLADDAVQRVFQDLAKKIRERLPSVHAIFGKNANQRFPLYSYVTFEDDKLPDVDPIVAAVDLRIEGQHLVVKTDLIGEESGEVYLEPVVRFFMVGADQAEWLANVTCEAERLAELAIPVVERLFEHATSLRTSA